MSNTHNIDELARKLAGNLSLEELRVRQSGRAYVAEPAKQTAEQQAKAAEYWQRVFSDVAPVQTALMVSRRTVHEMDYETARRIIVDLFNERGDQIVILKNDPDFKWVFSDDDLNNLKNIVRYFINDPACALSLTKGLFLYGAPGTGKTEVMQVMERFCRENSLTKAFDFTSLSGVHIQTKAEKDYDPITKNVQYDRCFDEFGRFVGPVIRFGESLDINEALIEMRYERFKRYGQLSHFIANTTPNELAGAFSPMIFDRLRSMCTSIHFNGESKRK